MKALNILRLLERTKVVQKRAPLFLDQMEEMEGQEEGVTERGDRFRKSKRTRERDYLDEAFVYPEWYFRNRFRIPEALYFRIHDDLQGAFLQDSKKNKDASKRVGHSSRQ